MRGWRPVSIGSTMESGGVAPEIPEPTTRATKPVPPLSGGTLLALSDSVTVAISDPDRDLLYLVDTKADAVRATVVLADGDEPGRLAEDAAGRVHVVLRRAGAIVTVDAESGTIIARRAVCAAARGIAYQKATDQVHVACAGGELVSLPAAGGDPVRTIRLDRDLRDVVVAANGSLLVTTFRKAEVLVIGADGRLTSRLAPGSGAVPTTSGTVEMRTPAVAWRMAALDESRGSVVLLHQTGVTGLVDPAPGGSPPPRTATRLSRRACPC